MSPAELTLETAQAYARAAFPELDHAALEWRADDGGFEAWLDGWSECAVWPCKPHNYGYAHGASLGFPGVFGEQ